MFKLKRKLLNEKAKVRNRDILIEDLIKQKRQLIEENADLRYEKDDAIDSLRHIYQLVTSNQYNNSEVFKRKIKELAETGIKN